MRSYLNDQFSLAVLKSFKVIVNINDFVYDDCHDNKNIIIVINIVIVVDVGDGGLRYMIFKGLFILTLKTSFFLKLCI